MKNWSLALLAPALVASLAMPALACKDGHHDASCKMSAEACKANPACKNEKVSAAAGTKVAAHAQAPAKAELVNQTWGVEGMVCEKCVNFVSKALSGVKGVSKVEVSLEKNAATVRFAKGQVDLAKLNGALGGHFKLVEGKAAATKAEHCSMDEQKGDKEPAAAPEAPKAPATDKK